MIKVTVSMLQLNGWVAVLIGSFILLDPVAVIDPYGIQANLSAGLMSELRAPGGLLIASGLMIVHCSLNAELFALGLQHSIMVYGGYGSARLVGFVLDGQPPSEILLATGIELVLFGISLMLLQMHRQAFQPAITGQLSKFSLFRRQ